MASAPRSSEDQARELVKPFGADPVLVHWTANLIAARDRFERRQQLADIARIREP